MLKIHLLRHAKTNQISPSGKDFDRELLPKGLNQCLEMKRFLKENEEGLAVDNVFCSTAKRTQQTHELVGQDKLTTHFSKNLYLSSAMEMVKEIENHANGKSLFIIGHNEGISDLASYLCDDFLHLQTCGFVSIALNIDDWKLLSRGIGSVKIQFRPDVK